MWPWMQSQACKYNQTPIYCSKILESGTSRLKKQPIWYLLWDPSSHFFFFCLLPWRPQWTASFFLRVSSHASHEGYLRAYLLRAPDWRLDFDGCILGEDKLSIEHSTTIKIKNMPRFRALKQQSIISLSFCGLVIGAGSSRRFFCRQCAYMNLLVSLTHLGLTWVTGHVSLVSRKLA